MKKGQVQIGMGILIMAFLLLFGGMLFSGNDNPNSKDRYLENKNDGTEIDGYLEDDYLFYLNETDLGRQKKVTESFPNIELGSKKEFNTVYIGNSFRLNANPFTSNTFSFDVAISNPNETQEILLYFKPERISGSEEVIISVNNRQVSRNMLKSSDVPIRISESLLRSNESTLTLSYKINKPGFIELFNWNAVEFSDLRVVEVKKDQENNQRDFDFYVDKRFLDETYLDLTISCDEIKPFGNAIKATINGYIVLNSNPECDTRFNRITANISLNILEQGQNRLVLETNDYYKIGYGITKKYYNDQFVYKFNINSFNDIIDVVMYGDFDKEVIDVRVNSQLLSLRRDEIKSIIQFLRFGTNEIEFETKPVEIEEFVIEKNQFTY